MIIGLFNYKHWFIKRSLKPLVLIWLAWLIPFLIGNPFDWHLATRLWPVLCAPLFCFPFLKDQDISRCISLFIFASCISSLIALNQFIFAYPDFAFDGLKRIPNTDFFHGVGLFSRHHELSPFLMFSFVLIPWLPYSNKIKFIAVLLLTMGIFSTGSRSAYLMFFIFLILFVLLKFRSIKFLIPLALLPFLLLFVPGVGDRISQFTDPNLNSNFERINILKINWNMLKETGFFGIGFGNFKIHSPEVFANMKIHYTEMNIKGTHNDLFQLIIEFGYFGSLLFFGGLCVYLLKIKRFTSKFQDKQFIWPLFLVFIGLGMIHNILQYQGICLTMVLFFSLLENNIKQKIFQKEV